MTTKAHAVSALLITTLLLICGSCRKTDNPQQDSEERTNFFTYEGYSFDINSVVQYDKGDNSMELWLSPESGLTSIAQIETAGDYIVLNTHKAYLGNRDRFNAQTSQESYIRFGGNRQYKYGDNGVAYIEAAVEGDQITLSFLAQNLYTKAQDPENVALQGSYTGLFTVEKEKPYVNEWGFDREHNAIDKVVMTLREDEGDWSLSLLNKDGSEGVKIEFPKDLMDQDLQIGGSSNAKRLKISYDGGVVFPIENAVGWVKILNDVNEKPLTVSISLISGERHLRVEYAGGFTPQIIKMNRFIFDYDGDSPYEGKQTIVKLMAEDLSTQVKFFFSPSEGYSIGNANSTHMPILIVPKSIINASTQTFVSMTDWSFEYDVMQVVPYIDEYRPHPADTDIITVKYADGIYEIDMTLTGLATGMNTSKIDLYYKGAPQK